MSDNTPIQQSLVTNYPSNAEHVRAHLRGIVLEVRHADNPANRAAQQHSDFRGFIAEATVFLVDSSAVLEHVLIPSSHPCGIDDYEEQLPRGCSAVIGSPEFSLTNLAGVNISDLDGDWCIVSFLNEKMHSPFISHYLPHPRNVFDPATSGHGNPAFSTATGTALDQSKRYFRRVNGVEQVITRDGDVWFSTYRSGYKVVPKDLPSLDGRFPRQSKAFGGSVLVNIKPSESLHVTFDEQVDGVGPGLVADDSVPQRNPRAVPALPGLPINTNLKFDKSGIKFTLPLNYTIEAGAAVTHKARVVRDEASVMVQANAPIMRFGDSATLHAAYGEPVAQAILRLETQLAALAAAIETEIAIVPKSAAAATDVVAALAVPTTPASVTATKVLVE